MKTREDFVEAIGRELQVNRARVGFPPTTLAETVLSWVGSSPPFDATLVAYGTSRVFSASLQISVVKDRVLYDFEFSEGAQRFFFLALGSVTGMICSIDPVVEGGSTQRGEIQVRSAESIALYSAIGDQDRLGAFLRFFKELSMAWKGV